MDALARRVYGHAKQGVGFRAHQGRWLPVWLRGLSALVATISTPVAAPGIAATRIRGGKVGSARGAASLVAEALSTAATPALSARWLLRGGWAFYTGTVISAPPWQ